MVVHRSPELEKSLDAHGACSHFVLMAVESIGEAYGLGWRVTVTRGHDREPHIQYQDEDVRPPEELDAAEELDFG